MREENLSFSYRASDALSYRRTNLPHAEKKHGGGWIVLEVTQRFGALAHRHVAGKRTELETMAGQLSLQIFQRGRVLRKDQAFS